MAILGFLSLFSLWGRGRGEVDLLSQARQLIADKYYTEAVESLTRIMRTQPENFDEAAALLREINLFQFGFNEKYEELLNIYATDPGQSYELIRELEELNPHADPETKRNLALARETAGFIYNRNRWEGLMNQALGQINQENYGDALQTYRSGFTLSRDIFDAAGYRASLVEEANQQLVRVNGELDRFAGLYSELQTRLRTERAAFDARNYGRYAPAFAEAGETLRRLTGLLAFCETAGDFYLRLAQTIEADQGDGNQVHHLMYMHYLFAGRRDAATREGIAGILDRIWSQTASTLAEHTQLLTRTAYEAGLSRYRGGQPEGAANFASSRDAAALQAQVADFWQERITLAGERGETAAEREGQETLRRSLAGEAEYYLRGSQEFLLIFPRQSRIAELDGLIRGITASGEEAPIREALGQERSEVEAALADWSLPPLREAGEEAGFLRVEEDVRLAWQELRRAVLAAQMTLLSVGAQLEFNQFAARMEELRNRYQGALDNLEGIPLVIGAGSDSVEIMARYPNRAQTEFRALSPLFTELAAGMEASQNSIRAEEEELSGSPAVQDILAQGTEILAEIGTLLQGMEGLIQTAGEQNFEAQRLRQDAERRMVEARQFFQRREYPTARDRLALAVTRFNNSLSIQEDPEVRRMVNQDVLQLASQIQAEENILVLAQVRQYLERGQNYYIQAQFAAAAEQFLRARNRWQDTQTEANPEIEYWMEMARNAQLITTGREIALTDPLYPEMTQYLNQAAEDYNRGVQMSRAGNSPEAENSFTSAERNVMYVQQFFPYNKEARVLGWQVTRQRDPQSFQEVFNRELQASRRKMAVNPREAYVELQDLQEIAPNNAEIQGALVELEYTLGIRMRPPDTRALEQARQNYNQALAIYNSNNTANFSVGIAFLEQAISLNPTYTDAQRLIDAMRRQIGARSASVLTAQEQRMLNEAIAEFNARNYIRVQILLDQLLSSPKNQNNADILDLRRRLQSVQ